MLTQSDCGYDDEVGFVNRYPRIIAMKNDLVVVTLLKDELITELNRLQKRNQLVKAVGSLTENAQE